MPLTAEDIQSFAIISEVCRIENVTYCAQNPSAQSSLNFHCQFIFLICYLFYYFFTEILFYFLPSKFIFCCCFIIIFLHHRCFILCLNSKLSLCDVFLCLNLIRLVATFLVYSALLLYFISFCTTDAQFYFVYIGFTSFDIVKSITFLLPSINGCFLGLLYFYFILQ